MKNTKKIILSAILVISSIFVFVGSVQAQRSDYYGLNKTAGNAGLVQGYETDVSNIVGNVVGTGLSLVAVLFFVLMIYGGFLWMTARGDESQASKAKGAITAAIVGIIIVLSAYAITRFVFDSVDTSAPNTPAAPAPAPPAGP